jgi:hypothetical protein
MESGSLDKSWSAPYWQGYQTLLNRLGIVPGGALPGPERLTELLPPDTRTASGKRVEFVDADRLGPVAYEAHIHATGQVSTRHDNWHDLFNALVWCRFPAAKSMMNSLHVRHLDEEQAGRRGPVRDALTLLDESGVVVASTEPGLLELIQRRRWTELFCTHRGDWGRRISVFITGHALLDKMLDPYKSMTAHALLLHADPKSSNSNIDSLLAASLLAGRIRSPSDLDPLPVMGIPGWWIDGVQDDAFYRDREVFRPRPEGRNQPPGSASPA